MTKRNQGGFTLIELLVVMAIIGILSGVVIVALGSARAKAKETKAVAELRSIEQGMFSLSIDTGKWPGNKTLDKAECGASNNEIANIASTNLAPNYLSSDLVDPWGRPYFFDTDYQVKTSDQTPCGSGGGSCVDVAVIGSCGPDETDADCINDYNESEIIRILDTTNTCPVS